MLDEFVVWAEVDLDAIAHNVAAVKRHVGEHVQLIAVVKANAYGHGMEQVARTALDNGASWLALNHISAAVRLRRAGIGAPILIMGYVPVASAPTAAHYDLTLAVTSMALAEALSAQACKASKVLPVHVKVDTGMGRFGLAPENAVEFIRALCRLPGLIFEGLYTHLACADRADKRHSYQQFSAYRQVLDALETANIRVPVRHVANSAATLAMPDLHLDAVRLGIALYGLRPSREVEPIIPLHPALALKSRVGQVRALPPGHSISYGQTFVTERPSQLALIPCGYGDGYFRLASNRGVVLVHGHRAPIRGRVCMDQMVVEVSGIEGVAPGDEVVLIGRQGDEEGSAEEVAGWAETINYEVVTHLLPRVQRVFLRGGKIVSIAESQ
ncbi:MAG: alanine racemase, partial [Ardenticatenia bacterium]|nr:alanine racemase [Ardenticatenia bacterium]